MGRERLIGRDRRESVAVRLSRHGMGWDGIGWDWMGREAMEHGGMGCETMEHRVVCCVLMPVMHRLLSVSGSCDEAIEGLERLGMRMLGGQWERGETVRGGEGHMTTTGSGG